MISAIPAIMGFFRKLGAEKSFIIVAVAAVLFLFWRNGQLSDKNVQLEKENYNLVIEHSLDSARIDTLIGLGEYSVIPLAPDTVEIEKISYVAGKAVYDTVEVESLPGTTISQVKIDTSKWFGVEGDRFGVRVFAMFHFPPEYSDRNRVLIYPLGYERLQDPPQDISDCNKWGIGLRMSNVIAADYYGGLYVRRGKMSFSVSRSMKNNDYLFSVSRDLITF